MRNIVMPVPPPNMDSFAPKLCFCGRPTRKSHDYWFCSTECARLDSLRSLDDPESHYRNVVRDAYAQAGATDLYPLRRMMSTGHLPPAAPPPPPPPPKPPVRKNVPLGHQEARDRRMGRFPTLSQVTGKVLTDKATAGEPLVPARRDRPKWEGFPNAPTRALVQTPDAHTFQQVSLDAIPLPEQEPEHIPSRSLRRVPTATDGLKGNIKKSVAALLGSRKGKDAETPEKVFGHTVNDIVPPVRKESLPSYRQESAGPFADSAQRSNALRRSRSFAGWNSNGGPSNGHDMIMHIIDELRDEVSGSFDPRSLFDQEEDY